MSGTDLQPKTSVLTGKEKAMIGIEGVLMAVPFVGPSLAHFISAPLTELRLKRVEESLKEVVEALGNEKAKSLISEEFVNLLENVLPDLSRATDEVKRQRFRDLLTNAAELATPGGWEEARLAAELLKKIDTPGLVILSELAKLDKDEKATLASRPVPQLVRGSSFDYENPGAPQRRILFDRQVVDYWTLRLREIGLVAYASGDGRGGYNGICLTERGWFLVKWTLR
jgi:hypothetical protein